MDLKGKKKKLYIFYIVLGIICILYACVSSTFIVLFVFVLVRLKRNVSTEMLLV